MRFTIFGLTISSAWGNGHATPNRALLRALGRRGHKITFYEKDVEYYALRRDFWNSNFCELVFYSDWEQIRGESLRSAENSDVVIVTSYCPEGARVNDEVLDLARPLRVFYDMDTPVTLSKLATGHADYLRPEQIGEFDLVLSFTAGRALNELRARWGAHCAQPLYGCVDPDVHHRVPARPDFVNDMSYMGTYDPGRQEKVDELFLAPARELQEKQFLLAGTLYPWNWSWPQNVRRFDHVAPGEHSGLFSSSRCTLNITRPEMAQNGYCPSGRFFEAAACGTPILTDAWEGLDQFFAEGEEILIVENQYDVLSALSRDARELERMAERARERTLDEHTGEQRAELLLSYLHGSGAARAHKALEVAS